MPPRSPTSAAKPAICGYSAEIIVQAIPATYRKYDRRARETLATTSLALFPEGVETSWNGAPWTPGSNSCDPPSVARARRVRGDPKLRAASRVIAARYASIIHPLLPYAVRALDQFLSGPLPPSTGVECPLRMIDGKGAMLQGAHHVADHHPEQSPGLQGPLSLIHWRDLVLSVAI